MKRNRLLAYVLGGVAWFVVQPTVNAADLIPIGSDWNYLHIPNLAANPEEADRRFAANWFQPNFDITGPNVWAGPSPGPFARTENNNNRINAFTATHRNFIRPIGTGLELPPSRERFTTYFRHEFTTTEAIGSLAIEYLIDDGAQFYLNGDPIASYQCCEADDGSVLPSDATPGYLNGATRIGDENAYSITPILIGEELPAGDHVLAVSVHQDGQRGSSNDMAFSMRLFDSYVYEPLILDRTSADPTEWNFFEGFEDPTGDTALDWTTLAYNDDSWDTGTNAFGYDTNTDPAASVFPLLDAVGGVDLPDMQDGYSSLYLRKEFNVDDPSIYTELQFTMDYDDGAVVYINGTEVTRASIDGEVGVPVPWDGFANSHESTNSSGAPGDLFVISLADFPDLLNAGENILAIHGQNQAIDSSDFLLAQLSLAGVGVPGGPVGTPGDFNGDGLLDAADIDLLTTAVRDGTGGAEFDVDGDGSVTDGDRVFWVEQLKNTWIGDSNFDGEFGSGDLVAVFVAGEFEDAIVGNSTWATGDWNGDGDFTSSDIVTAFVGGGFEVGPRPAVAAVPEPTSAIGGLVGMAALLCLRRRRR